MPYTVGPKNPAEDEQRIASGYRSWVMLALAGTPTIAAYFFDTKTVLAVGFGLLLALLWEIGGRLHDLCIRHRRTNLLLTEQIAAMRLAELKANLISD